ncbi:hypothetical protein IC614_07935 [Allosphingosinicella flava]|uniref:Uncharacterized protein n=1 Tax=Allosphingosinicella flava TaxID=2771430 RepID=A0A7T2GI54_9SPHN|nr:hypothetical protein [Sphingosinicella flava]QPQ54289.1 hypothetical protein IC614_07935 [Sphingosinicella flava]
MSDEKLQAAQSVALLLRKFEEIIDEAVCCGAELAAQMPRARQEANLPALAGQPALDNVGEAVTALIAARRHTVAAHKYLDRTREQMGLPPISFGDESPKEEFLGPMTGEVRRLRDVA